MNTYTQKELKRMLYKELKRYEAEIGHISPEERKGLRGWAMHGGGVYDNPYLLYGENGHPFDYITASRITRDMQDNPKDYQAGPELWLDGEEDESPF